MNRVINALYLGFGVCLGGVWYLYVLETLGYAITRRRQTLVMLPGLLFTALNLISIWTGWIFTVSPENVYAHGPLFWLQTIGAYGLILLSFAHITLRLLLRRKDPVSRHDILNLYKFYGVTVLGAIVSFFTPVCPAPGPARPSPSS